MFSVIMGRTKTSIVVPDGGFVFKVKTTSANQAFTLPTTNNGGFNYNVYWGDGSQNLGITTYNDANTIHTYASIGEYTVTITGQMDAWSFNYAGSKLLVSEIVSWGGDNFLGFTYLVGAFSGCTNLTALPATGGIKQRTAITDFSSIFYACSGLTSLPADLFRYNTSVTTFYSAFNLCTGLTSLPTDLFRYNTSVTNFSAALYGCNKLTTLPTDIFRYNTLVTNFSSVLYNCSGLTSLDASLFQYNTNVTNFTSAFRGCTGLTSLPTDLFRYNTSVTQFGSAFYGCTKITTLPVDIFRYNTAVTTFAQAFNLCTGLLTLPADLFRYNAAVTAFSSTFAGCSKLQLRSDIFYYPNFLNKFMNFSSCFNRTSFSGTQGTAPDLWNASGWASVTSGACFAGAGNSLTSLTNYASIPAAWK